ncbi:helix-turn-helix domain-containing protein [Streptomyces sp. JV176]|uniref:PucR family transcriptional regulator n=1 Tax=Streptomyces sp. JV176 TaxID=858630 RepID=UPI002E78D83B|nr:helix-turn-helix domain-containing protein [Streptomyces sp. JV176]MEE1802194.1 helix-turn-helix domain-containing protein [Streptomyces sp. JV176]
MPECAPSDPPGPPTRERGALTSDPVAPGRPSRGATLADLAEVITARRLALAQAALAAMRAEIPGYAAISDETLLDDVVTHVRKGNDALGLSLADARPAGDEDVAFVRPHAARRARLGVSLADFMHAVRITHRTMWEATANWAAGSPGRGDVALEAAGLVMEFFNRASTVAAQAYLDAEQLLAVEGDRVRRDLLEDLLAGREPAPGPRLSAATRAGLSPDTPCAVVTAVPVAPLSDEYGLRSAAALLGRAVGEPARVLTVLRQDEIVIVRALRDVAGELPTEPVRSARQTLADRGVPLAIGISTRHATVADLGTAYHEAVTLMGTLPGSGGVVSLSELRVLDYLTLRADETVARIIPARIRDFVTGDLRAGGSLIRTVECFADNDLNVRAAAQELGIHINTAHHRLARVEARTGCALRRLADLQELLIAIRLLSGGGPAM